MMTLESGWIKVLKTKIIEINEIISTVLLFIITEYLSQLAYSWMSLEISHFNDCHSHMVVISLFIYRKEKIGIP